MMNECFILGVTLCFLLCFVLFCKDCMMLLVRLFYKERAMKRLFSRDIAGCLKDAQWRKFMVLPLFSLCAVLLLVLTKADEVTWLIGIGLVGMNFFVFSLLKEVKEREGELKEAKLFEVEARNRILLYEEVSKNMQKQKELAHEYTNHLTCMQELCQKEQYAQLKDYLGQISGGAVSSIDRIDTNHTFVNAVLNTKYQEAAEKNIIMPCKINDLSKIQIENQDIVLLLSNLLNNAIEACERYSGKKVIQLKLVHSGGRLILSVRNPYDGELHVRDGVFATTKTHDASNHGLGLRNVLRVIDKYDGYYAIEHGNGEFYISIMIPQSPVL